MLQLFDYYRSSACFRVRIVLNLKQLEYEMIPIHLIEKGGAQFSATYKAINPQSLIPSLNDDNKILTQSLAIIEYLDELYPSPRLLPKESYKKSLVRAFALAIAADIHPLNNLRVLKYLKEELNITEEQKNNWYQHWIAAGLTALEKKVVTSGYAGNYCFGDAITMADVFLIPQMYNARRFNCDLSHYPHLNRIDAHCQTHEAFQAAWPQEEMA